MVKNQKNILKRITVSVALLLTVFQLGHAQEQASNRDKAYTYLYEYQYARAIPLLLKLVDRKNPRLEDMEHLAESYYWTNDYEQAVNWYTRVVGHPDSSPENLLLYAKSLKQIAHYRKAIKALEDYAELTGRHHEVALELKGSQKALDWLAHPNPVELYNEGKVNTPNSEFSVYPMPNGAYYVGEPQKGRKKYGWTGETFLQLHKATLDGDGRLEDPEPLADEINQGSKYHVGPLSSNGNGDTLYVTRTYFGRQGEKGKENGTRYMTHRLELYVHTKDGSSKWDEKPFPYNNVEAYSLGHAVLGPEEKVLYFISDRPGGHGGTDIWFSEMQENGQWAEPINAGNTINSNGNEMFPSFGSDGLLYFSSDGHAGMGGLDIFSSKGSRASWEEPINLQHPINSGGDDFSYVLWSDENNLLKGFFASNRMGGKGGDDIYGFTYKKPKDILLLEGITYEGPGTEKPLSEVSVTLYDKSRVLQSKKLSDGKGRFSFEIDPGATYKILGQKTAYYSDSLEIRTVEHFKNDTLRVSLHLEPMFEVGKKIVLEDIHYDFDKHNIREDAADILNELSRILRDYPSLNIELSSHTDSRGSDNYNVKLSDRRARAAVDYLVNRGIARDRMVAKGYGESQLLNPCSDHVACSEEAHQENRRTEIKVLAF